MAEYYKYAERSADSQVNWSEVGKGMSDMLAETNRVREEKKAAIDKSTRDTLNELATSPNGEHIGARQAALEYADQASNFVRIQDKLLKSGQLNIKDYTVFRQNLNDGTDKAFNALKVYQENYANTMQRYRDGKASLYETRKREQGEGFGNWNQAGLYINPSGIVMAGMKTKKMVDGKEVTVMDDAPGKTASVDWVNGMLIGEWNKYDYASPVKNFVDNLGEEKKTAVLLGGLQRQGKITSIEDITSRKDIDPATQQVLFKFITAENDAIQAAMGTPFDKLSILLDHAKIAPNGKPYDITNDPKEAAANENLVLEVIDPNTGQGAMKFSEKQDKDAQEFIRGQMRAQYDYKEEAQVVGAVSRDEESEEAIKRKEDKKEKDNALGTWGDVFKATTPAAKQAALEAIVGSKIAQDRGLLDIDVTSQPGKVIFKYADAVKNRTLDYDPNTVTLRQWNELGNEVHGIDNVAEVMARNKGGDPNMRMGASQRNFQGVRAGRTAVKDPEVEFSNKITAIKTKNLAGMKDKQAAAELAKIIKGTGITIVPNVGYNPYHTVNLKVGDKTFKFDVNYNENEKNEAATATANVIEWIEANTPAATKKTILTKGQGVGAQY